MRKRHRKALLEKHICPSCRGSIAQHPLIDCDIKVRCRHLRCRRVIAVLLTKTQFKNRGVGG
jgi:hypothetical protein